MKIRQMMILLSFQSVTTSVSNNIIPLRRYLSIVYLSLFYCIIIIAPPTSMSLSHENPTYDDPPQFSKCDNICKQ
jgi:hypothetical protein